MPQIPWGRIPNWLIGAGLLAIALVVAIQMWRGDAIVCANGAFFAKNCPDNTGTIPKFTGAVVAFDSKTCPHGWDPYGAANGRFIVGVGQHSEFDRYGNKLEAIAFGDQGGARTHKLTILKCPATHMSTYFRMDMTRPKTPM